MTPARVRAQAASVVAPPAAAAAATAVATSALAPGKSPIAAAISSLVGVGSSTESVVDGSVPVFTGIPEDALLGTVFDDAVYSVLDAMSNFLSNRPASPFNEFLQGALLTVRRTFFDQAPFLDPVQLTGEVTGPITGTLQGYDAEGEPITYAVIEQPLEGTVTINPDGSYTYTPGLDFDGTDAFIVSATDATPKANSLAGKAAVAAFGGNILDPKRPDYSEALVEVDQGAVQRITFTFQYFVKGLGRWNQKAKTDLQWAASRLGDAVNPQHTATVNFKAVAVNEKNGLAAAGSPQLSRDTGFHMTIVQNRIINGTNPTHAKQDGTIDFNFRNDWGYNGKVVAGSDEYDFQSVAMHELLHTFGFTAALSQPGCNEYECDKNGRLKRPKVLNDDWPLFSKFLSNKGGVAVISTAGVWDNSYNDNLVGKNGGLFFSGTNANKAFGGPVPLFTPNPWKQGSSGSHMDDAYFNNNTDPTSKNYIQIMNAEDKEGVKAPTTLSAYEIGILKDIGYTM